MANGIKLSLKTGFGVAATCRSFFPAGTCHRRLRSPYFRVTAANHCRFRACYFGVAATCRRAVAYAKAVTSHRTPNPAASLMALGFYRISCR
jgi:hypothetical protein